MRAKSPSPEPESDLERLIGKAGRVPRARRGFREQVLAEALKVHRRREATDRWQRRGLWAVAICLTLVLPGYYFLLSTQTEDATTNVAEQLPAGYRASDRVVKADEWPNVEKAMHERDRSARAVHAGM